MKGIDLAVGVELDRVVFQERHNGRSDDLFFFLGEVKPRSTPSFFVRAETAFSGPIFQAKDVRYFSA